MKKKNLIFVFIFLISCFKITFSAEEVTNLTTRVGEYTVFDCEINFPQSIVIPHLLQWRKDNELIFSSSEDGKATYNENFKNRIHLLTDSDAWQHGRGSINITSIRETDEGWYECKVVFPNRMPAGKPNGTWFHLTVEGGNLLAVPPINETVMENQSVTLKCVSKLIPPLVTWYKNNVPLDNIEELQDRIQISSEGSLNIFDTRMEDVGYYSCEIGNEEGQKQSAGAYLNIQYKAKIIYAPRRVYFPIGKPGQLDCHYRANPEITKIRWEKDGFLFDAYNVPGVSSRKNGSLYFSKVDDSHGGEYTCTPYNDLGSGGPSPRMHVVVQRAPVFTVTPNVLYMRTIGDKVSMQCDAVDGEGINRPTISWFKKHGEIPSNRSYVLNGNLTIVDIRLHDRGSYQCVATNEAATITSEAELLVEESIPPLPPYNVTTNASTNSVIVKWLSRSAKPKLKFSLWYRWEKSREWKMIELNNNEFEVEIQNLSPGETYDIMVCSQDENGEGMFSKTTRVTTKCKVVDPTLEEDSEVEVDREFRSPVGLYQQIGPPNDVYIQVTEDGYKVIWKPPKHGQEMLKYYTVVWYREPSEERIGSVTTLTNNITIEKLEEQKLYRIQILAMSTNDYETASQKYIYCVPNFSFRKYILAGAIVGATIVLVIFGLLRCICNCNSKSFP